jgi:hypothetical protein
MLRRDSWWPEAGKMFGLDRVPRFVKLASAAVPWWAATTRDLKATCMKRGATMKVAVVDSTGGPCDDHVQNQTRRTRTPGRRRVVATQARQPPTLCVWSHRLTVVGLEILPLFGSYLRVEILRKCNRT